MLSEKLWITRTCYKSINPCNKYRSLTYLAFQFQLSLLPTREAPVHGRVAGTDRHLPRRRVHPSAVHSPKSGRRKVHAGTQLQALGSDTGAEPVQGDDGAQAMRPARLMDAADGNQRWFLRVCCWLWWHNQTNECTRQSYNANNDVSEVDLVKTWISSFGEHNLDLVNQHGVLLDNITSSLYNKIFVLLLLFILSASVEIFLRPQSFSTV